MEIIASTYSRRPTKQGPPPFIACGVSALPEWSASHPTDTLLCISAVGAKRCRNEAREECGANEVHVKVLWRATWKRERTQPGEDGG